jgi:uncharacterized protein (DUF2235 family)
MGESHMAQQGRKLIVCCDGTWNRRDQAGATTNVAKMARAVKPHDERGISQLIYYHPGVGTGNWFDWMLGGGFGVGLSGNIESAYSFLVDNFEYGDEIFLFGFSRGAFTVRSLAGFIGLVGLLEKADMGFFPQVYKIYRSKRYRSALVQSPDPTEMRNAFRKVFPEGEANGDNARLLEVLNRSRMTEIFFIGVWDTVGSLGVPFRWLGPFGASRYSFHNTDLGEAISYAYQALAIDERRGPFPPTLWTRPRGRGDLAGAKTQVLEQVWFAGCHSNVGGGYADCGLSDISFLWMAAKAMAATAEASDATLAMDEEFLKRYIDRSMGALIDSRAGFWLLFRKHIRSMLCEPTAKKPVSEFMHLFWPATGGPLRVSSNRFRIDRAMPSDFSKRLEERLSRIFPRSKRATDLRTCSKVLNLSERCPS